MLKELRKATAEEHAGRERNQVAPEQGRFLAWLVEALGVRSAIEIGVFTGYSSLAVALASPSPFCITLLTGCLLGQSPSEVSSCINALKRSSQQCSWSAGIARQWLPCGV